MEDKFFKLSILAMTFLHSIVFIFVILIKNNYSITTILQIIVFFIPVGFLLFFLIKKNPFSYIFFFSLIIFTIINIYILPVSGGILFLDMLYFCMLSKGQTSGIHQLANMKMKKELLSQGFIINEVEGDHYYWQPNSKESDKKIQKYNLMDLYRKQMHYWKIIGLTLLFCIIYGLLSLLDFYLFS